ncbi:MAG TPA: TolC family protein [Longimicrobiales bacterium]
MRTKVAALVVAVGLVPGSVSGQATSSRTPLSLADAVKRAAASSPGVELSQLQVQQAEGQVREARSALLPSLVGSAGWMDRSFNLKSMGLSFNFPGAPAFPDLVGPFNTYDARFQVHQALLDVPGLLRLRAAGSAAEATDAQQDVTAESSAQKAAAAYLQATRAQAVVAARKADVALAKELVDLAETQLKAGVGTGIDVTRAKTQLVTAEGLEQVAENQAEQAQIGLARTMGLDPSTRFALADTLTTLDALTLPTAHDSALAAALKARPELEAVAATADAARQARQSIASERLPRFDLLADYGLNGPTVGSAIRTGQLGVAVTLPLLDGFRREARLTESEAALKQAEVRLTDTRQQVQADVESALLDLRSGQQQLDIAHQRLALATQEVEQARERFQSGVAGNIEVIEAQSSLVRARDADIDARFTTALARVNLAHAVGATRSIH